MSASWEVKGDAPSLRESPERNSSPMLLKVRRLLERAEAAYVGKRCGGDQRCPWCKQWVNHFMKTYIRPFPDGFLDEVVCGNCGGTSIWKWEIGFFYVTHGEPPKMPATAFGEGEFIAGVIRNARQVIDARIAHREQVASRKDGSSQQNPEAKQ